MKITLLGTASSQGVPVPLCSCPTCLSSNPKDKRLRCSAWIQVNGISILIDSSIDFRIQALRSNIKTIDAILLTHHHFDHLYGIDDLRSYMSRRKGSPIPLFASSYIASEVMSRFAYAFKPRNTSLGLVHLSLKEVAEPFKIETHTESVNVIPIEISHGKINIFGYRIGGMAYLTDYKAIPDESVDKLQNLNVLFISALKHTFHPSHATIREALNLIEKLKPKKAYLIHIHHSIVRQELETILPENVKIGEDLLEIFCD